MSDAKPRRPDARADRLRLADVRRAFRLVMELRELGAEPDQWRPHLVRRLRDLLDAQMIVSAEVHFRATKTPGVLRVTDIGWAADDTGNVWKIQNEHDDESPETYLLARGPDAGRQDATDAAATAGGGDWGRAGELIPVKPVRQLRAGGTFILSQYPLPHAGAVDQLGLHRGFGEEPFGPVQHRLAHLFHVELGRLWTRDAIRRAKDPAADLPPRLAQTLAELLAGSSEKQIAMKLELSRHTVHNYVKALHQRFAVSSRGELLAKVGQGRTSAAPKLSLDAPRPG